MRRIKVAQIGFNRNSHSIHVFDSLKKQNDIYEIVGYVLPENERERLPYQIKRAEGYKELTIDEVLYNPDIEAVVIETDEIYLTKYALMAAKAGKHIHMEKPGSRGLAEFEELVQIMRETKKVFHIGYMYRYNPYVMELLQQIKRGDFGEIISVEAQMNCQHSKELREWLSYFRGGNMFFLGCHLIDLIYQIQGKPERVVAFHKSTGLDGNISEDCTMAVLEYKNGISFAKVNSTEPGGFLRRQLVVSGTKAMVELKPFEKLVEEGQVTTRAYCDFDDWHKEPLIETTEVYDRYDTMMNSFAAMVRGEKQNLYTLEYEFELYKILMEACGEKMEG